MTATVRLQREPFDAAVEAAKLTRGRSDIGAVVTFTGICRGHEAGAPLPDARIVMRPLRPALWRELGIAHRARPVERATQHVLDALRALGPR